VCSSDLDYGVAPERKALSDIAQVLEQNSDIQLIVKLHPKESECKYEKFPNCYFDKETDSIDLIMASDIVISMMSMFLIEARILGKKTLSYQPNELDKDKFILTRNEVLPFINNPGELKNALTDLLNAKEILYNLDINFNAISGIVQFVEKKLCRN
jgi:predicted glycosyltransferase